MRKYLPLGATAAALLTMSTAAAAQTMPQPAPAPVLLSYGTPVTVKTVTPLDSRKIKLGERFEIAVAQDVVVKGRILIPAGSIGAGEVRYLRKKGVFGRPGQLVIRLLYVDVGSNRIEIGGLFDSAGRDNTAGMAATGVAVGVLAVFVTGKSAVIPPGTEIKGYAAKDSQVAPQGSAAS
jgi:hypothetical protein